MIENLKKTLIIAEGCDNHFGKLDNAKKMVIKAKKVELM
jgi:sialic acid synthase SpsE